MTAAIAQIGWVRISHWDTGPEYHFEPDAAIFLKLDRPGTYSLTAGEYQEATTCIHRIADARNKHVKDGYVCVECGALFRAADHDTPPTGFVSTVDVEKLLCEKLGRDWAPTGISIVSLVGALAEPAAEPTVAECIKQLDTWNGRLEAAIDRQAHAQLGQHPNDDAPLEHLP